MTERHDCFVVPQPRGVWDVAAFRAECSCGWKGAVSRQRAQVQVAAVQHVTGCAPVRKPKATRERTGF